MSLLKRLFGLCLGFQSIMAAKHFESGLTSIRCTFNPKFFYNNYTCFLPISTPTKQFTVEALSYPNLTMYSVYVKASLIQKRSTTVRTPFMGFRNVLINFCNVLSGRSTSLILDLFLAGFRKCSNVYHACPFSGAYYMRNCSLDDSKLPPMMPSGNYSFSLIFLMRDNETRERWGTIDFDFIVKGKSYIGIGK